MRCVLMLTVCLGGAVLLAAEEPWPARTATEPDGARLLDGQDDLPLTAYRARRTLTASTRGGRMRAALVVWTSLDETRGFEWAVVEEHGSGLILKKVLKAALEAEGRLTRSGDAARGALTPANYAFGAPGADEAGRVRVGIRALRRDTTLVDGTLVLAGEDGDLLRVEGFLVKRPSFWTRKVWIAREYGRVAGVRVPLRMTSRADVLMAGRSDFEMRYDYESVNGRPVNPAGPVPPTGE